MSVRRVERQPFDLLGRRVVDGAHEHAGPRQVGRGRLLRDPEVGEVHVLGGLGHEDVGRLDVAVDQVAIVGRVERGGDLLEHEDRPAHAQLPVPPHERPEVGAVDVAHRDVESPLSPLGLARVVDRDHVRVVEIGARCDSRMNRSR